MIQMKKVISSAMAFLLAGATIFSNPIPAVAVYAQPKEVVSEVQQVYADTSNENGLAENIKDGVMFHAWSWPYNTVKQRISEIAAAGFTTIQVSPIQPNKDNPVVGLSEWWKFYQPTDFSIGNALGSKEDFSSMCQEAHKYGVKIVVDVVANHLANNRGLDDGKFNNASTRHSAIPDWLRNNDSYWHINDYGGSSDSDRKQMTHGPIGMPDLNTANTDLQNYILKFLNDAQDCGADGFRFDAAKHIETPEDGDFSSQFWPTIANGTKAKNKDVFLYGEILNTAGPGNFNDMKKYTKYIRVTNNKYGHGLINASKNRDAGAAKYMENDIFGSDPNNWVIWVESHDTFAGEYGDMTDSIADADILVAWLACAARANAVPLFFARPEGGYRQGSTWKNPNALGADRGMWKDKRVAAINKFHNYFAGQTEYASTSSDNKVLIIERGTEGVALINFGDGEATVNAKMNKVKDGTYTDQLSGNTVNISGGNINAKVPARSVAVIYNTTPVVKGPNVAVSKESGTFTEPFDLTLTPSNATQATYSVNGGDSVNFTSKTTVKIGENAEIGDVIKVKVTATGEGDPFSKEYTYTKADPAAVKFLVRVKKSDFSSAPYIYAYDSTTEVSFNGIWPGTAMTAEGDYYVFSSNDISTARVIFSTTDGWRDPADMQPGHLVSGLKEYNKSTKSFSDISSPTKQPTQVPVTATPKVTETPTATPKVTASPTATPKVTETPTATPKVTASPTATPKVTASPTATPKVTVTPTATPKVTPTPTPKVTSSPTATPKITSSPKVTENPNPTVAPKQTPEVREDIQVKLVASKASPQYTNTKITLKATGSNGKAPYKYTFIIQDSNKKLVTLAKNTTQTSVAWTPKKAGKYTICVSITDAVGDMASVTKKYTIQKKELKITGVKANKKAGEVNKTVKFATTATAKKGALYYKVQVKLGTAKSKTIQKYKKNSIVSWKPKKKGKYKIYIYVKDGTKKVVRKTINFTVK